MKRNWIAIALLLSAASVASADDKAPRPGPEVEKLGYFVGKWKVAGEVKETPFMPGGKFTSRESCEWFTGKYVVICKGKGKGPMGPSESLGIMSYSTEEKAYLYYGVDNSPMAWSTIPRGTLVDGVWTYDDESKMGGQMVKSRYTLKILSASSYTWIWEMESKGEWVTLAEGKSKK